MSSSHQRQDRVRSGDMNQLKIPTDGTDGESLKDYSVESPAGIEVYFRHIEDALCQRIVEADFVAGAVAWLTSERILAALAKPEWGVSIVVQKEDFLRPDIAAGNRAAWAKKLRARYDALNCGLDRYCFRNRLGGLSYCGDPSIEPVRCVGNHNRDRSPAFPRMHNKFFVFCRYEPQRPEACGDWSGDRVFPYAAWTGSFNATQNATRSFENAILITVPEIVKAFYEEWGQIMALSEELDWSSPWCEPEWRVGS